MHSTPFPTKPIAQLIDHNGPVHSVTFSSGSGQYILTGGQDRAIRLFNPTSGGRLVQKYSAHGYEVLDVSVASDNSRFASVGGDKVVYVWDVATAQTQRRFTGHAGRVNACKMAGEGDEVVVTGSFDGTVKLWDLKARGGGAIMTLGEAKDAVSSISVRGSEIFAGSVDGRVRVYDVAMGRMDVDVIAPGSGVTSVTPTMSITANAREEGQEGDRGYLVSSLDSCLRLMDQGTGKCLQTFSDAGFLNRTYRLRSTLAMSDEYVLSGSEDGRIFVWDVVSGEVKQRLWHTERREGGADGRKEKTDRTDVVSAVAWNPMRKQWASAGGDGRVVIWGYDGEG